MENKNTVYSASKELANGNKTHERIIIGTFVANTYLKLLPEMLNGAIFNLAVSDLNTTEGAIKFKRSEQITDYPTKDLSSIDVKQRDGEWRVPSWFGNNPDLFSALERNVLGKILMGTKVNNFEYNPESAPPYFEKSTEYVLAFLTDLESRFFLDGETVLRHRVLNAIGGYFYDRMIEDKSMTFMEGYKRGKFIENFRDTAIAELLHPERKDLYTRLHALLFRVFYKTVSWDYNLDTYLAIANAYLENVKAGQIEQDSNLMVIQMLWGLSAMDNEPEPDIK